MLILFWTIIFLYSAAWGLYCRDFYQKRNPASLPSQLVFSAALFSHILYVAAATVQLERIPIANLSETISTFVAMTAALYWVQERRLRNYSMSAFILPVFIAMLIVSAFTVRPPEPIPAILHDVKFEIHVLAMLISYGAFTVSCIASIMFLLLSREIQQRRLGLFYRRLPSLPFFEQIGNSSVTTGVAFATIGLGLGTYFALQVWQFSFFSDPKIIIAFINYFIYLLHFGGRTLGRWHGRRTAIISVVGFGLLLFSFIVASLLFGGEHKFL